MGIIGVFPSGGGVESIAPAFSYTGSMLYSMNVMSGRLYHLFVLESSGILTVTGTFTGDIWLCGGGGGVAVARDDDNVYGSGGGGGGYTAMASGQAIASGAVVVGAAARTGGTSSYNDVSAAGGANGYGGGSSGGSGNGKGGNGGSGGGGCAYIRSDTRCYGTPGTGQGTTTRPFADAGMPAMCAGGGGTGTTLYTQYGSFHTAGGNGGSDGASGTTGYSADARTDGTGGTRGGGTPKSAASLYGYGSGGCCSGETEQFGSHGVVMIRIAAD